MKASYHKPEDQERSEKDALSGRVLGSISCCEDYEWGGSQCLHKLFKGAAPPGEIDGGVEGGGG